jgi:phospholipid/cholesterol/gamma-HCH transport system substrate-binding protein
MPGNRKILVGLFVIGGLLLFAVGLFWIGDRRLLFSENIPLSAEFANLGGLKIGSKVLVSGMDAGEVLATEVPPRPGAKFRVRFRVLEKFRPILRTDSVASIQVEGVVGSKVLQVDAGSEDAPPVSPGVTIQSREPVELADVVQQTVDTIKKINTAVDDVQGRVVTALGTITDVGQEAHKLVVEVGADAAEVFSTGHKIADDIGTLVDNVQAGRGTVGKLLNDDSFYVKARGAVEHLEAVAGNAERTSEDVKKIVADLQSREIGEKAEKTVANLEALTAQAREAIAGLVPSGDGSAAERGLMEQVRDTLANAREATGDLAENMEALKRNWLFRGFFKSRGFYDLDSVSLKDYLEGEVAPERGRERVWLHHHELFAPDSKGLEIVSEAGRKKLGEAITPYLRYAPNTALMIEGYASEGSAEEQFLRSRDRARAVRRYLIDRFGLNPRYIGAVPMGGVASEGAGGKLWDGIAVVHFPEKQK